MKPTQTPTAFNSFPVNLTLDELETILFALGELTDYTPIYNKLKFLLPIPDIGDACRHSAHIPEAPGQGGITIFEQDGVISFHPDVSTHPFYCDCNDCKLYHSSDVMGQGGN